MDGLNYIEVSTDDGNAIIRVDLIQAVCYNEIGTCITIDGEDKHLFVNDSPVTIVKKLRECGCKVL